MQAKIKGKITMVISIGCTAFILTMIMFTQFKTVEQTDITAIETMREAELRTELASWKAKYDEINEKLTDTQDKINVYKEDMETNEKSSELLAKELEETEKYLGYTDVEGEGLVITLEDTDYKQVESYDLLSLVNELRLAGAEAISINDERIVSTTEIVSIDTRFIVINGKRVVSKFEIKAIGNKKYLESAISIKGGYVDEIKAKEIGINYTIQDNIAIPRYSGNMNFKYAEISK